MRRQRKQFIAKLLIFSFITSMVPSGSLHVSAAQGETDQMEAASVPEEAAEAIKPQPVPGEAAEATKPQPMAGEASETIKPQPMSGEASEAAKTQSVPEEERIMAGGKESASRRASAYSASSDYLDIGACGTNMTYVLHANGVLTITGEGDMSNFPDAGSVPWFQYRSLISTVTLSANITGIGAYAFDYCVQLDSITIPDTVKSIGAYSFYGCASLSGIRIPGSVTGIGACAFGGCTSLSEVTIPDSVTSIGASAFAGCTALTEVTIPDSVTSIGEGAFDGTGIDTSQIAFHRGGCGESLTWVLLGGSRLFVSGTGFMTDYTSGSAPWYSHKKDITEIVLSDGVASVGNYAFQGCEAVTSVVLADSVTRIGDNAFAQCRGISEFRFPSKVSEIAGHAFYQSGLTKLEVSAGSTVSIRNYAFAGCTSLERVLLGRGTLEMGDYVFQGCTGLVSAEISADFGSVGSHMFSGCTSLSEISLPDGLTAVGAFMFSGCKSLEQIGLSSQLTEIREYAFQDCTGIGRIALPDSLTALKEGAFSGCSGLKEIRLPERLETIGNQAFQNCLGISAMVIPNSVTGIGEGAFSGCSHIERLTLPFVGGSRQEKEAGAKTLFGYVFGSAKYEGGTEVKQNYSASSAYLCYLPDSLLHVVITGGELQYGAFDHCAGLKSITMPAGLEKIGTCAFRGCGGLEEIAIPANVTDIGGYAFGGCTGLNSLELPEGLLTAGTGAFSDCTGLTYLKLPSGLTRLESYLFSGCTQLQGTDVPAAVTDIGDYVWKGCAGLKSFSLPDTVTGLGRGALQDCTGLQAVTISKDITEIGRDTFRGCVALQTVRMPGKVTAIGESAFSGCALLEGISLPEAIISIGNYAFSGCLKITQMDMPEKVEEIGTGAFQDCIGLMDIRVPDSTVRIGSGTFSGCSSLRSIRIPFIGGNADAGAAAGSTLFGYIFGTGSYSGATAVKQFYSNTGSTTYYIPDTLTSVSVAGGKILFGAFCNCTQLKEVTLPENITAIGSKAFSGCTGLKDIVLPGGLTDIGEYAFSGCTGLEQMLLPGRLEVIGSYAFQNCSGIRSITVPDSVTAIQTAAFSGCSSLESMTLPFVGMSAGQTAASTKTLFGYIFGTGSYTGGVATQQKYSGSSATYYIPSSLKTVVVRGGNLLYGAFYNCSGLIKITLPEELKEIGNYAFYNCSGLTEISLPAGVTGIGNYAFKDCVGLKKFSIPGSVTKIEAYTFSGCSGLQDISIPEQVTAIGSYAFQDCSGLKGMRIPSGVAVLETGAFQNCSGLTSITVPDTVTTIQTAAFSGCSSLDSMSLPFVGMDAGQTAASSKSLFGYIFGTAGYTGGVATKQFYSGSSSTYYIPASLKRAVITGGNILYGTFYNCSGLTEITLPQNLTGVGKYAFCNCSGLTGISLPSGVSSIGSNAFQDCTGLTEFSIPEQVTAIESYTFSGCSRLENIVIPDGVATVGTYAFKNCSSMRSILVPDSVTAIQDAAFSGCSGLESMTLPFVGSGGSQTAASVKTVFGYIFGTSAYAGGTAVKQFYSNSSRISYVPSSLKTVVITGGNILTGAFYNCSGLTSITLPDHLTDIGKNAFYNCSGLAAITVPPQVTAISANAFANCTNMASVTFTGSAPASIDSTAFTGDKATVFYPKSDAAWDGIVGNNYGGTLNWSAHTHDYRAVITAPSCMAQGYTTYTCTYCNSSYVGEYVNALGHRLVADVAVQATCTKTGLTQGEHCSVCGEVLTPQETIQALSHKFTGYVSNKDATFDSDGTMTAYCEYGCGEKNTVPDEGSMLTDDNPPKIEITVGENKWAGILHAISFGLFFKQTQTAEVTAADDEKLPDGRTVSRLDKVYYYIADDVLDTEQLADAAWEEYNGSLALDPGKKYIVYAKAADRSGNLSYASTDGMIVDDMLPVIAGVLDKSTCCRRAVFTVTDLCLRSVTDNGRVITPSDGKYTIDGDDARHDILAEDSCGNVSSISIVVNREHTWQQYSYNNDASCTAAGTQTAFCQYGCGALDTRIDKNHPAMGHSYGEPVFSWSDDYKNCTAAYTCTRDESHFERVSCAVRAESPDAVCLTEGKVVYTATAVCNGVKKTDTRTVTGAILGHDYRAEFSWSADKNSCTASLTCQRAGCSTGTAGHILSGLACTVKKEKTDATCAAEGREVVSASVTVEGNRYTDTGSMQVIPADNTRHVNTQLFNKRDATCMAEGYTGDTYCNDCRKTVKTGAAIKQLDHAWSVGVFTRNATCKETGAIRYTCTNGCGNSWEGIIPANPDNHIHFMTIGTKEATETENGYTGDTCCSDCGKILAYGAVIPANGGGGVPTVPPAPQESAMPLPGNSGNPGECTASPDIPAGSMPSATPGVSPGNMMTAEPSAIPSPMPSPMPQDQNAGKQDTEQKGGSVSPANAATDIPAGFPAEGSKLKDKSGAAYIVTEAGPERASVSFAAPKNRKVRSVRIPADVAINGVTYQVTSISGSACSGCRNLRKVSIGKNVKQIGRRAFYQCTSLTEVTVPAKVEKIGKKAFFGDKRLKKVTIRTGRLKENHVGAKAFAGLHRRAVITVPPEKLKAYRKILKKRGVDGKWQAIVV